LADCEASRSLPRLTARHVELAFSLLTCERQVTRDEELPVADKSPKKSSSKKPGKSLKEKRADKQAKKNEKRPGI
jgi:hypothetical protein